MVYIILQVAVAFAEMTGFSDGCALDDGAVVLAEYLRQNIIHELAAEIRCSVPG